MTAVTPVKYDSTVKKHEPFGEGDVVPGADIQIDPDGNNLLRSTGNGLLVELAASPDVANQYVSSSTGSDETGDGTQANPLKTIRFAVSRLPDHTTGTIYLKAGDTFTPEAGADGYVVGGTVNQQAAGGIEIGSREITIEPYGNAVLDNVRSVPGVDQSLWEIGTQPVIQFTYSELADAQGLYASPGFHVDGGSLEIIQVALNVTGTVPAGASGVITTPFYPNAGAVQLDGCYITLNNAPMICGPATNTSKAFVVLHQNAFNMNGPGKMLLDAAAGFTFKSDFSDQDGSVALTGFPNIKQRVTNFNSDVAPHGSSYFRSLTVISADARTYQGLMTTNNIVAAT